MVSMLWIDHKYIGLLSPKLDRFARKTDKLYNMRCPVCGDSHKNKHKARGYLFEGENGLVYKCHNCGFSGGLGKLLEQVDPHLYQQYKLETFKERGTRRAEANTDYTPTFAPKPKAKDQGKLLDYTIPLSELPSGHRAVLYCLNRKIPEEKFKMLAILNKDNPALADFVVDQKGLTFTILNDGQNVVSSKYFLTGLPETFIVDKQGIIREKVIGAAQWDTPVAVQMITNYINE